jgi:hypothetical protein
MPISEPEWNSIRELAERVSRSVSGRRSEFFQTGIVTKRDMKNRLIWLKGFGNDPIPIIDFEHEVKYYDTDENGDAIVRSAKVQTVVPRVGQAVLVAYEMGVSRNPRCLGVIQSTNWFQSED